MAGDGATAGINAALEVGGQITGMVTSAATSKGLEQVSVTVYDAEDEEVESTQTAASGSYSLVGLPTGSYEVGFTASGANYAPQFYSASTSLEAAKAVPVNAGSTTAAINAALVEGGSISGAVRAAVGSGAPGRRGGRSPRSGWKLRRVREHRS